MKTLAHGIALAALAASAGTALAQTSPGAPLGSPCGTTTNSQALGSSTLGSSGPVSSSSMAGPTTGSVVGTTNIGSTDSAVSSALAGPTVPGSLGSTTPSAGTS